MVTDIAANVFIFNYLPYPADKHMIQVLGEKYLKKLQNLFKANSKRNLKKSRKEASF